MPYPGAPRGNPLNAAQKGPQASSETQLSRLRTPSGEPGECEVYDGRTCVWTMKGSIGAVCSQDFELTCADFEQVIRRAIRNGANSERAKKYYGLQFTSSSGTAVTRKKDPTTSVGATQCRCEGWWPGCWRWKTVLPWNGPGACESCGEHAQTDISWKLTFNVHQCITPPDTVGVVPFTGGDRHCNMYVSAQWCQAVAAQTAGRRTGLFDISQLYHFYASPNHSCEIKVTGSATGSAGIPKHSLVCYASTCCQLSTR